MRFTTRDLLWLMTLVSVTVGLGFGWMRESNRLKIEINEMSDFHHAEMERVEYTLNAFWKEQLERQRESLVGSLEEVLKRKIESLENEHAEPEPPEPDN